MKTKIMNDREKLDVWNTICIENGWSKPRELERWLLHCGIKFSGAGSAVPDQSMLVENKYNLQILIDGVEGEGLATLILEVLCGVLMFPSTELERLFWVYSQKRLKDEFNILIPEEIIPNYAKNDGDDKQLRLF